MSVLAVFRSRSQTLQFESAMKKSLVPVSVVSTPKQARVGCGLSLRFDIKYLPLAKSVLRRGGYSAFVGFFKIISLGAGTEIIPV